jgi:transglutaminase-like putative cysteine protease
MYDVRQFKPTIYLLLMMGIAGFSMAAESPGLFLLASGAIFLNAWLVKTCRFIPLPRWLANLSTLVALLFLIAQIKANDVTPLLVIGQFLVLLHVVKLFEQRANRDYAQMLILSLLLMVAAAISTASLLFGLLFIAYLFVSLYCCLLFHLKVEADRAKSLHGLPASLLNPATFRQDQRYLSRSMRRLTALISVVAVFMAVAVFLFFPRGGQDMLGTVSLHPAQALTGFSDQVSFQNIAQISVSNEVIARVEMRVRGQPPQNPGDLWLRGSTLDVYTGRDPTRGNWKWMHSRPGPGEERRYNVHPDETVVVNDTVTQGDYEQKITLQPTGTSALFAMAGLVSISDSLDEAVMYTRRDGIVRCTQYPRGTIQYTVVSTGQLPSGDPTDGDSAEGWRYSQIDPEIAAFARRPEVCGTDSNGRPLALLPLSGDHSMDGKIAGNFEAYLRNNFEYTLDLTNAGAIGNRDPIVAFLTDFKKGHCEYFAGAMTLMCQSAGIPARVVVGFHVDAEAYNSIGNYYLVRQSDAHAWCEAFSGTSWQSFDPTSENLAPEMSGSGKLAQVSKFFDFLEFKWATSIIAYDADRRQNLVGRLNFAISRTAVSSSQNIYQWPDIVSHWWDHVKLSVLDAAIVVMMLALIVAIAVFFVDARRLRRRARRIGLAALPSEDQLRLVLQLGFYDDLLRILDKHKIARPANLTPLEFSRTLSFLPNAVYDEILRLTRIFYRIRYGGERLNAHRQRHLAAVVHRIQHELDESPTRFNRPQTT